MTSPAEEGGRPHGAGGPPHAPAPRGGPNARTSVRIAPLARRLLPWLVAVGCLAWAFAVVPVEALLEALAQASLERLVPLAVVAVVVWFLLESAAYAYAFSRFNAPLSWREARSLRAVTYLLTVIHWHVAKAAVVLRLHATHGIGLLAGTSTLLLYQMVGILVLAVFATIGAVFRPSLPAAREVLIAALLLVLGTLIGFGLLRADRPKIGLLEELRRLTVFQAWRQLELRDLAMLCALKAAYQLVFVLVYWLGLRAFDVALSFPHVLVATALLQVVGGLPIAPAGLGTQQAAMLLFFSDPRRAGTDAPAILAFAFVLPFTTMVLRALLACLYLGDLARPAPPAAGTDGNPPAPPSRFGVEPASASSGSSETSRV
ncbi:MAG: YbhN family protein [Myxococcota bacterium]